MSGYVIWNKGKPVTASSNEAARLNKRIKIIDKILKQMGYPKGYANFQQYIKKLTVDFEKYMDFLDRVEKEAKENGC